MKDKIKVFDAFAGYGGATFGMKRAKIPHEVVGYSEINPYAIKMFELNHKGIKNYGDITKITPKDLPDFDFFTGGFPCQTFSTVGKGHGELDTRGTLFYDIIRICEEKQPTFILLENVKGLTMKKHNQTFLKIINELKRIGYNVISELLNRFFIFSKMKCGFLGLNRKRIMPLTSNWSLKTNSPKSLSNVIIILSCFLAKFATSLSGKPHSTSLMLRISTP